MAAVFNFTFLILIYGNCRTELVPKNWLNAENRTDEKSVSSFGGKKKLSL